VTLHEEARAGVVDLAHVQVTVNRPLPSWFNLKPASAPVTPASGARRAAPAPSAKPALGELSRRPPTLSGATTTPTTLTALVPMAGPSTSMSFDTDAPVAAFGRPDPFEADLSAGALTAGTKLDLPAGPGG
jgi:hypothetical protein